MTETSTFKRNDTTGLVEGVEYPRLPNGRIDWKALINPVHITFNAKNPKLATEISTTYGAPADTLVYADVVAKQPVADKHILVLLAGFIEVAELRGYQASEVTQLAVDQGIVAVGHSITWLPNEEEPNGKTSSGTADATLDNTGGFGYLAAMAGNRAFVRAVKNGLGIRILGFDEIAKKDDALPEAGNAPSPQVVTSPGNPIAILKRTASECGFTLEDVRKSASKRYIKETEASAKDPKTIRTIETDPSTWKSFDDVPKRDCLVLVEAMKNAAAKAKATAKS
jgi:hypothetical protein